MPRFTFYAFSALVSIAILGCTSPFAPPGERSAPNPAGVSTVHYDEDRQPTFDDWAAFADRIKEAGRLVDDEAVPGHPIDRAEGYRYLLAMIADGIFEALYGSDLEDPQWRTHVSKFSGEAMTSSDARYQRFEVDGRGTYRIWGQLGNARQISLQAYAGVGARETFDLASTTNEQGQLSIVVGGAPRDGNWQAMSPDAELIQLREYFSDWEGATRSHLFVERLDTKAPRGLPTDSSDIAAALERAVLPLHTRVPFWKQRMDAIRARHDNSLGPARLLGDVGLGGLYYGEGWFDLNDDEALLIEFEAPDASHWSYQLGNYWSQMMDWANFTSSTNGAQARRGSDGRYRLVIAHSDPGVPNWLDTAGHREGLVLYRYHEPRARPVPGTRLIRLSEVRDHLPADTPWVTPAERAAEIEMRRRHKRLRWQP